MRKCLIEFAKKGKQQQIIIPGDKPDTKYIHTCKAANIGLIITPETEGELLDRLKALDTTCKRHCSKLRKEKKKVTK